MGTNFQIKTRIAIIALILLALGGVLACKLYQLQIGRHEELLAKARKKYTATSKASGKRGEIYSRDGTLLVGNAPCATVVADPSIVGTANRMRLAYLVARCCDEKFDVVFERLAPMRQVVDSDGNVKKDADGRPVLRVAKYALLARSVNLDAEKKLRLGLAVNKIRGVTFERNYCRAYPKGNMLANILGLVNIDADREIAISGLERVCDRDLASTAGSKRYERARDGRPLDPEALEPDESVRDGKNVYLTVVEPIQSILEEELDNAYADYTPVAVYAIMLDPRTGDVMAIGQRPSFNPAKRSTITPEADRPRLVADTVEPGSVIKPFTYAAALDAGRITPQTRIDCENGRWVYYGKPLSDTHQNGKLSIAEAIQVSSNIAVAKLGLALGNQKVYDLMHMFGFGQKTNLPIRPESRGILTPVKRWDGLTVTRIPMGYSINVTPVQMARAYCALANGGKLPELHLIDRIEDRETEKVVKLPRKPPVPLMRNPATMPQIVDMMVRVTEKGGTAREAAIPGYRVAGKTGTSQKLENGHRSRKTVATFSGFVPAENPAFVLYVAVDEPRKGGRYGGRVSGPVFQRIAKRTLEYLNIPPTEPAEEKKP